MNNRKLLVLGGNPYANIIHNFALDYNVELHCMSNDPNAAILKIANKRIVHSSADAEFVKKYIKDNNICGVYLGGNETVITKVCKTINDIGLPCYCTPTQWKLFQNKGEFKKTCEQFGLPVVKRFPYSPDNRCDVDFPVITKPADGCGSCGFSICNDYIDLEKGYKFAKENSLSGEVIVEKYVNNTGHVVFYTFSNGKSYFSLLQDKYPIKFKEGGSFVGGFHNYPSYCTEEFKNKFGKKLSKMFETIGLREGNLWIEVFHDGDNYYFNEAGFRYGGSISVFPICYFTGVNQIYSDLLYSTFGVSLIDKLPSIIPSGKSYKKYYCQLPIYLKPGKIEHMSGIEDVSADINVIVPIIKKHIGDTIYDTGDFSQNIGYIHFVYNNKKELIDMIDKIENTINIVDSNGNNMVIKKDLSFYDNIILR